MVNKKTANILWFEEVGIKDVPLVGGKNASLGEMYSNLTRQGVKIPNGFAITAHAYQQFLKEAALVDKIKQELTGLDTHNIRQLKAKGSAVRQMILRSELPEELKSEIKSAYEKLGKAYGKNPSVAVRSSATAEDLPDASFAGQQETYLNVVGIKSVLDATKKGFASLFTDRAISYRQDKGFSHFDVSLSIAVQMMVRSDISSSGVMFSIDTESGFDKVVIINSIYGLGEYIVQGKVTPDEFIVFKPSLEKGKNAIISKKLGIKNVKLIYSKNGTKNSPVSGSDQEKYALNDKEVLKLAVWAVKLEKYFSKKYNRIQPMDMEWAKDGRTGELFIVQARPETVYSVADKNIYKEYNLKKKGQVVTSGVAVGAKIGVGKARVIKSPKQIHEFKQGEILVTEITDPDWEPIMKIASAIVTDKGGRTSHAAIVSRELGIPAIVGTQNATRLIKTGQEITVDCASGQIGTIYKGLLPYQEIVHRLDKIPETKTNIMVNIGAPDEAFRYHSLPVRGVGLGRLEFIISSYIQIHPNALLEYSELKKNKKNSALIKKIDQLTVGYQVKKQYYVEKLAEGIAKIGAAFWPHKVIIRFSDFKTNEYRTLLGGNLYEPEEENPMIGWRGASRYYDKNFAEAFKLELEALKKVRSEMGLENVVSMIPFCRTVEEAKNVLNIMKKAGIPRSKSNPVYVMCEIPSNIILADEFLKVFDGMSIGSNDLTQLTLGLDRDSDIIAHVGNEKNQAVIELVRDIIKKTKKQKKYIGICGQAPSDHPSFAQFLVEEGIESMSLTPDTVITTIIATSKHEKKLLKNKKSR